MKNSAETYARALCNAARELDCLDGVAEEIGALSTIIKNCGKTLLANKIPSSERARILRDVLSEYFRPLTLEFLLLMLSRRQLKAFPAAAERFMEICGADGGTISLRLPYEPDEETLKELRAGLVAAGLIPAEAESRAEAEVTVDGGILGGFIAGYRGYQLDASLKTALEKLRRAYV